MAILLAGWLLFTATTPVVAQANQSNLEGMAAYLMVYFSDSDHSLHMALSYDGYRFTALNDDKPVIDGKQIALQKGIRDPYIMRSPEGGFYLAMTDLHIFAHREGLRDTQWQRDGDAYGWGNNRALVLMKSTDLINWSYTNLRVDQAFPGMKDIGCAWAPEMIYDEGRGKTILYFTMRFGNGPNQLYYCDMDEAFTKMETEPKLLFEYPKQVSYIDADITRVGDRYHLFYTPHDGTPGVKHAVSDSITSGYAYEPEWVDPEVGACEAPTVWKRLGEEKWVVKYDSYGIDPHNFGFLETTDFNTYTDLGHFNTGVMKSIGFTSPKHGAVIHLTMPEADRLAKHWGSGRQYDSQPEK